MTYLFASPDIAALVAALPPPVPTKSQPSVVRSNSGNGILSSSIVLERFRRIIEIEPERIKKSDLPRRLGIERIDWLFECYQGLPRIRWNTTKTLLLPEPVWQDVLERLQSQCQNEFVEMESFVTKHDLEELLTADLDGITQSSSLEMIAISDAVAGENTYVADKKLVEDTKADIVSKTRNVSDEKVNLSQIYHTIPNAVLRQLAKNSVPQDQLEIDSTGIVFVPADYAAVQGRRLQAANEARIQGLLEKFENDDFVLADTNSSYDDDASEVRKRYTGLHADVEEPSVVDVDPTSKLVVLPGLLERTMRQLREEAPKLVRKDVGGLIGSLDDASRSSILSTISEPDLATILLKIPSYSDEVASAIREAISHREHEQLEHFGAEFRREIIIPAQLYSAGIASIKDPKLKHSLDDYATGRLKNDVIPTSVKSARENKSFASDRNKIREIDKFIERSGQANDTVELFSAISKFVKKIKLSMPNNDEKEAMFRQVLERKAFKEMPKMTRGSDVLQNLFWILLSATLSKSTANGPHNANDSNQNLALFMSPGKDTGRMIKQYQVIAPDEDITSKRLAFWREKLKTGSETKEDLDEMRALAEQVVGQMLTSNQ